MRDEKNDGEGPSDLEGFLNYINDKYTQDEKLDSAVETEHDREIAALRRIFDVVNPSAPAGQSCVDLIFGLKEVLQDEEGTLCLCLIGEFLGGGVMKTISPIRAVEFLVELQQACGVKGHATSLVLGLMSAGAMLAAAIQEAGGPEAFALKVRAGPDPKPTNTAAVPNPGSDKALDDLENAGIDPEYDQGFGDWAAEQEALERAKYEDADLDFVQYVEERERDECDPEYER